jgi:predicted pyridoxine 5'-phosphate oxidase superfamily flavin-nucleotide-binding protein
MVVMSPETRRRVKVSGKARQDGGSLLLHTEQVLGNCPKYLQARTVAQITAGGEQTVHTGAELSDEQVGLIAHADTFFIGSYAPGHGADANHRGGQPGFITVAGPRTLIWPDYVGNSFYMTLGNIELNPHCGLVFLDWERGHTVQLAGTSRINWSQERTHSHPGALRTIEFSIDKIVQIDNASPLRWQFHAYSRFNPPPPARSER